MVEVRAARADEVDGLVALLCESFDLPFAPARELVLGDPYFDLTRKRVAVAPDGAVVSCLTIIDQTMWIGEAQVPVAGIAGVTTRADLRGQGIATALLRDALAFVREQGYGFSALLATDPRCYRRLGWEHAGRHCCLTVAAGDVPRSSERAQVRVATRDDIPSISGLYDAWSRGMSGCCLRDAKRWDYLWQHARNRFVYDSSGIEGYAVSERREIELGCDELIVGEIVAATDRARSGLAAALARAAGGIGLRYAAGWRGLVTSGLAVPGARIEVLAGPMFRVVDLRKALLDLAPNLGGWTGRLICRMVDDVHPSALGQVIALTGDGGEVSVDSAPGAGPVDLEGEATGWSVLLSGGACLEDASARGLLSPRSSAVVRAAAGLFPARDPAIPAPDYF